MYRIIKHLIAAIRHGGSPDIRVRLLYIIALLIALGAFLWRRWWQARGREQAVERVDRFYVVSKDPGYTAFASGSSLTETFSSRYRVCLRFYPRREGYHSDDNDIILNCSEDVYLRLREGTCIRASWLGEELISFTEETEQGV